MGEKYEVQSAFVDQCCVMKIVIIIAEIIKVLAPQVQIAFLKYYILAHFDNMFRTACTGQFLRKKSPTHAEPFPRLVDSARQAPPLL